MNKEYRISELMENYTDNELFLEGEQTVDTEKAVSDLLGQVKPRRRANPLFKAIAVAAAAMTVLATTMAATIVIGGRFATPNGGGGTYEIYPNGGASASFDIGEDVLVKEGDRLYFVFGDEKRDITDIIDPKKPYIYSYSVEGNSQPIHIIIGGTPEHYSYVQLAYFEGMCWWGSGKTDNQWEKAIRVHIDDRPVVDIDGNIIHNHAWSFCWDGYEDANGNGEYDLGEKIYRYGYNNDGNAHIDIPADWRETGSMVWLIDGLLQLGFIEAPETTE